MLKKEKLDKEISLLIAGDDVLSFHEEYYEKFLETMMEQAGSLYEKHKKLFDNPSTTVWDIKRSLFQCDVFINFWHRNPYYPLRFIKLDLEKAMGKYGLSIGKPKHLLYQMATELIFKECITYDVVIDGSSFYLERKDTGQTLRTASIIDFLSEKGSAELNSMLAFKDSSFLFILIQYIGEEINEFFHNFTSNFSGSVLNVCLREIKIAYGKIQ